MMLRITVVGILGFLLSISNVGYTAGPAHRDLRTRVNARDAERGERLSPAELAIIRRARSKDASAEEKALADSICEKKCKVCFDGQHCDLKCAEKNCGK